MQEVYSAAIRWDEEAGVWYVSETNFPGLAAEAETQQGLLEKIRLLIPELHDANRHLMQTHAYEEEIVIQLTTIHRETIKPPCATLSSSQTWYADRASIPSQTPISLSSRGQGEIE